MEKTEFSRDEIGLIERFRVIKEGQEGWEKSSLDQYEHDIKLFKRYIKKDLRDAKMRDFNDFLTHLKNDNGYREHALRRKYWSLKAFYGFLCDEKHIKFINPMKNVKPPKLESKSRDIPTKRDIYRLIETIHKKDFPNKTRDLLIVAFFLHPRAKVNELHRLNIQDINFKKGEITFPSKRGTSRTVELTPIMDKLIRDYLKIRPEVENEDKDAFFISDNSKKRLVKRTFSDVIRKYRDKAGITRDIISEGLRDFIPNAAARGMDVARITTDLSGLFFMPAEQ